MTNLKRIASKYAASFMSMLLLMFGYFFLSGNSVSDTYDMLSSPLGWGIFGVYLILASIVIEKILSKYEYKRWNYASAYIIAGSLFWFMMFIPLLLESVLTYFYFVIYGSIFTVFPFIIFFGIDRVIHRSWKRIGLVGIPALMVLLTVLLFNPAIKQGFSEEYGDTYYRAQFDNFNGQETIDIPVNAGEIYLLDIKWKIKNDARYGMRISRNVHDLGELREVGDWTYQFHANGDGVIDLTYDGVNIKGEIEVKWEEISSNE